MIDGGAVIWARQTLESDIFFLKPHAWFKIWFWLVMKASHKDLKQLKQGELLASYDRIMGATGASRQQVKDCLKYLKKERNLDPRKTTRGMIYFVRKYGEYQNLSNYKTLKRPSKDPTKTPMIDKNGRIKNIDITLLAKQTGVSVEIAQGEYLKAMDWIKANGKTYKDYNAFVRNWIRNRKLYQATGTKQASTDWVTNLVRR